jgi:hypothetical protein
MAAKCKASERFRLRLESTQTDNDRRYRERIGPHFEASSGTALDKLNTFARFVPRQAMSVFLARHEIFRHVVDVHGDLIECGVFMGAGLFTWAQLSAIYEPVNHIRRIVGFDTFTGFPGLSRKDASASAPAEHKRTGAYRFSAVEELEESIGLYDLNRAVGHIPRIELVKGDATRTIPRYVRDNPHCVVALLYLDFDLYEPTLAALQAFLPRMPKGAVLAFDELGQKQWPGETQAVMKAVGISNLRLRRFNYTPAISYAVLE